MTKLSIAILVAIFMFAPKLSASDVFYPAASYESSLSAAQAEGKLLAVYFQAADSPSCVAMTAISRDKELAISKILSTSFYTIQLTLDNAIGQQWESEFSITISPTLLFFDHNGLLIQRTEQAVSSDELIQLLEDVRFYATNGKWPMEEIDPTEAITSRDSKSSTISSPAEGGLALPNRTVISRASSKNLPTNPSSHGTTHRILIQSVLKGTPLKGIISELKNKFGEVPISVTSFWDNQKQYLQVWLGRYNNRGEAELMLQQVWNAGYSDAKISQK